jgi:predicted TIM-barrel fold metal-dependent hydrolase
LITKVTERRSRVSAAAALIIACTNAAAEPVIDVHMHVLENAAAAGAPHPRLSTRAGPPADQAGRIAAMLDQMETHEVVLGLVHGSPDSIRRMASRDPSRFLGFPWLGAPGAVLELGALEANLASGEWRGVGEILTVYNGLEVDDPKLRPYYDLANRHHAAVFWHTGIRPGTRAELGRPLHWETVLLEFPDLKPVMLHAGAPFRDEMLAIMGTYPNVYVDTGPFVHLLAPEQFYAYYGYLVEVGLGNRIMFGTDWVWPPEVIGYSIEVIENAPWDPQVKRDILYNNAARFLGLSEDEIRLHHAAAR